MRWFGDIRRLWGIPRLRMMNECACIVVCNLCIRIWLTSHSTKWWVIIDECMIDITPHPPLITIISIISTHLNTRHATPQPQRYTRTSAQVTMTHAMHWLIDAQHSHHYYYHTHQCQSVVLWLVVSTHQSINQLNCISITEHPSSLVIMHTVVMWCMHAMYMTSMCVSQGQVMCDWWSECIADLVE